MTNSYTDMKNSSCFLVFSNPAEAHPCSMQFVNEARFGSKQAKMIVVEPRRTRLASQADLYLRIRPGTDIAFINGVLKRHFANIDADDTSQTTVTLPAGPGAYLRATSAIVSNPNFFSDVVTMTGLQWPRWADALFRTNEGYSAPAGKPDDYLRYGRDIAAGSAADPNAVADPNYANYGGGVPNAKAAFADKEQLPVLANDLNASASGGTRTVYEVLKARVAAYDTAKVADICDCDASIFEEVADTYLSLSWAYNHPSPGPMGYKAASILYAMGTTQHTYGAANVKSCANLQICTGNIGKQGGGVNALRGVGNVQGSTDQNLLWHLYMAYIGVPTKLKITNVVNATTVDVKGTGLWAHNIQQDNGLNGYNAYDNTKPEVCCRVLLGDNKSGFLKAGASTYTYVGSSAIGNIANCGTPVLSFTSLGGGIYRVVTADPLTGALPAVGDCLFTDYETWIASKSFGGRKIYPTSGANQLFGNGAGLRGWEFSSGIPWGHQGTWAAVRTMFSEGFGSNAGGLVGDTGNLAAGATNELFNKYMAKGNGFDWRTLMQQTDSSMPAYDSGMAKVTGVVNVGMNTRVTAANALQQAAGFFNLDWLLYADPFLTESADAPRKNNGVTYFLPVCHTSDTCGTISNSGRIIQWLYQAAVPPGGSKTDLEIISKLARAVMVKADIHLGYGVGNGLTAYEKTWRDQYAGDGATAGILEGVGAWVNGNSLADPATAWDNDDYRATTQGEDNGIGNAGLGYPGYQERVYIQMCTNTCDKYGNAGTNWLHGSKNGGGGNYGAWHDPIVTVPGADYVTIGDATENAKYNRSQARNYTDSTGNHGIYPGFAWAWLRNRRIFYNKGGFSEGDVADIFVSPDEIGTLMVGVPGYTKRHPVVSYTGCWRGSRNLTDVPVAPADQVWSKLGYTPVHWEPHESPRGDLVTAHGQIGMKSVQPYADDDADRADFPLVLTTYRHCEHYQGGGETRRVPWLIELVPEAVVELNSADAAAAGISNGDLVEIQSMRTKNTSTPWIGPWRAVVGTGVANTQKVGPGVVAVPWHWGSKGLATGPTANELCIDALDANTRMPETKACLCKIQKV